jgi:hypothetical protein
MNIFHFLTPAFVGRHTSLFIGVLYARVDCSIVLVGTWTCVQPVLFVLPMESVSGFVSVACRRRNGARESLVPIKLLHRPGIIVWLRHLMWRQFHSSFPILFIRTVVGCYRLTCLENCELLCASTSRNQRLELVFTKVVATLG